ncbi:hypothetical protein [Qipengyuania sp. ASV99]|uniref:hypothetical protein n=1 Tax=Qipengyuania sp. ASV99 TaxID=3399681 RepID=UPI003A4C82B8
MTLFAPDLYRNFGIGFLVGAAIAGAVTVDHWGSRIESPARAAAPLEAPAPADEFLIAPLENSA